MMWMRPHLVFASLLRLVDRWVVLQAWWELLTLTASAGLLPARQCQLLPLVLQVLG
jgi:hypothetical protein